MNQETMQGVLCMQKPAEFTSFDVIGKLRGILHMRRLGHTGTLDPMATGVLPVLVGKAARACDILPDQSKIYRATVQFGWETDTEDVWGTRTAVYPEMHWTQCSRSLWERSSRCRLCIPRFLWREHVCTNWQDGAL